MSHRFVVPILVLSLVVFLACGAPAPATDAASITSVTPTTTIATATPTTDASTPTTDASTPSPAPTTATPTTDASTPTPAPTTATPTTDASTPTPAPTTATPTTDASTPTTATPTRHVWVESASPSPLEICQITDQRRVRHQPNNVGFPLAGDLNLPTQGSAKILFIPAQFLDAVGEPDPIGEFAPQLEQITRWSERLSLGRFRYEFQTTNDWVNVPVNSADYPIGWAMPGGFDLDRRLQNELAEEILRAAGPDLDYAGVDGIIFHFPASVKGIERDLGGRGIALTTPAGRFEYFFWGAGSYHHTTTNNSPHFSPLTAAIKREKFWKFWIHEMLHSQGMALHAPGNGSGAGLGQDQYGLSAMIMAWEQFLLGWLSAEHIFCADSAELEPSRVTLHPGETHTTGRRAAIIRVGPSEALVIESRRPVAYSRQWSADATGVLVYRVDTTFDNDRSGESSGDNGNEPRYSKWAYFLAPDGAPDPSNAVNVVRMPDVILTQGDSLTAHGVRITLERSDDKDYVVIVPVGED